MSPRNPDLTDTSVDAIVYVPEFDKGTIAESGVEKGRYLFPHNKWHIYGIPMFSLPTTHEVTHWMPWPQPPEKNQDGKTKKSQTKESQTEAEAAVH